MNNKIIKKVKVKYKISALKIRKKLLIKIKFNVMIAIFKKIIKK